MLLAGCEAAVETSSGGWDYTGYTEGGAVAWPDFKSAEGRRDGRYPKDCSGLISDHAFACAEQVFWQALSFDHAARVEAFDTLGALIERFDDDQDMRPLHRGMLHFRRVHMTMALGTENELDVGLAEMLEDIAQAKALVPATEVAYPFIDAFDQAVPAVIPYLVDVLKDQRPGADEKLQKLEAEADRGDPAGIFMFVTTAAGLPLDSGWPQRAATFMERYEASCGNDECGGPSDRAPFALHGTDWVWADTYARIGNRAKALEFFDRALARADADRWPVQAMVQQKRDGIDELMATYAAFGDDGVPMMDMAANGRAACVMCHQPAESRGLPGKLER